ncbi:MAG: hypothetical protein ACK5W0_16135 [Labrys sp. (in: a-proteobacteria)]
MIGAGSETHRAAGSRREGRVARHHVGAHHGGLTPAAHGVVVLDDQDERDPGALGDDRPQPVEQGTGGGGRPRRTRPHGLIHRVDEERRSTTSGPHIVRMGDEGRDRFRDVGKVPRWKTLVERDRETDAQAIGQSEIGRQRPVQRKMIALVPVPRARIGIVAKNEVVDADAARIGDVGREHMVHVAVEAQGAAGVTSGEIRQTISPCLAVEDRLIPRALEPAIPAEHTDRHARPVIGIGPRDARAEDRGARRDEEGEEGDADAHRDRARSAASRHANSRWNLWASWFASRKSR